MLPRALADLVVVAHLAFVVFAVAGGLLALRWRWMPWLHLPAAAWGVVIELAGWTCPLTPVEAALRRAGGGTGYEEGFVAHYLLPVLYPEDLGPELQMRLAGALLAANALAYAIVWRRARRRSPQASSAGPG